MFGYQFFHMIGEFKKICELYGGSPLCVRSDNGSFFDFDTKYGKLRLKYIDDNMNRDRHYIYGCFESPWLIPLRLRSKMSGEYLDSGRFEVSDEKEIVVLKKLIELLNEVF